MSSVFGRSPSRPDISPAQGIAAAAVGVLVIAYPMVVRGVLEAYGVRAVAVALLAVGSVAAVLARRAPGAEAQGLGQPLVLLGLALAAGISGSRLPLLLVPAFVYAVLARLCWHSADAEVSLIERGARLLQPRAPDFIGPYCRRVTRCWAVFFAITAAVITLLALLAPLSAWESWTLWGVWLVCAVFMAGEFVVRKIWFRYYLGGPLDRVFAALFPADATPEGRRSQAYIEQARSQLEREA